VAVLIPVAPVVACVILVRSVFTHNVGEEDAAPTVLEGVAETVPVAISLEQLVEIFVTTTL
jgi:hypothetical protein